MNTSTLPHEIIIGYDRDNYNRFQAALDVQDAGNLRALAREFVKTVDAAMADTQSTMATWEDPAVRLFVNKFESLCLSNLDDNFSRAYAACNVRK